MRIKSHISPQEMLDFRKKRYLPHFIAILTSFFWICRKKYINLHEKYITIFKRYMANLNRLKVVLVEKDKTGKWLSDQLGKSPCTVSKWCKNTVQPDLTTLDKIAKLLDVHVKDLLNSTEKD